jgi:hypothetical protein
MAFGHVRGLRARRPRVRDHRLQHLRRGDHRFAPLQANSNDVLLQRRDVFSPQLHAHVTAGHHHSVGSIDDRVQPANCLAALDLGDHGGVRPDRYHPPLQLDDVIRASHEGQGYEICAGADRAVEIGQVLAGNGRR